MAIFMYASFRLQYIWLPFSQASHTCGSMLSLLTTNIPRSFKVNEWDVSVSVINSAVNGAWEEMENPVENYFEFFRNIIIA